MNSTPIPRLDNGFFVGHGHFNAMELATGEVAQERPPFNTATIRLTMPLARTSGSSVDLSVLRAWVARSLRKAPPPDARGLVLLLNNCSDRTAAIARGVGRGRPPFQDFGNLTSAAMFEQQAGTSRDRCRQIAP